MTAARRSALPTSGLTPAPGAGSPQPILPRDWAHPRPHPAPGLGSALLCTSALASALHHLHRDWAHLEPEAQHPQGESRRRCGRVPPQMWAGLGADVDGTSCCLSRSAAGPLRTPTSGWLAALAVRWMPMGSCRCAGSLVPCSSSASLRSTCANCGRRGKAPPGPAINATQQHARGTPRVALPQQAGNRTECGGWGSARGVQGGSSEGHKPLIRPWQP